MAKIVVDGFVFDPSQVGMDIDEAVYGEESGTVVAESREEHYALTLEYNRNRLINSLQYSEGYPALQEQLDEEAKQAVDSEISYRGLDREKKEKLWLDRVIKTSISERIRQIVSDASLAQKPILHKEVK